MGNVGREPAKDNDLFFTCSLIDYMARKTKNTRTEVVNALGEKNLAKIYDLADIYHSDNIERVSDDFIRKAEIMVLWCRITESWGRIFLFLWEKTWEL